jgi:hypothetical protein
MEEGEEGEEGEEQRGQDKQATGRAIGKEPHGQLSVGVILPSFAPASQSSRVTSSRAAGQQDNGLSSDENASKEDSSRAICTEG